MMIRIRLLALGLGGAILCIIVVFAPTPLSYDWWSEETGVSVVSVVPAPPEAEVAAEATPTVVAIPARIDPNYMPVNPVSSNPAPPVPHADQPRIIIESTLALAQDTNTRKMGHVSPPDNMTVASAPQKPAPKRAVHGTQRTPHKTKGTGNKGGGSLFDWFKF